MASKNQPTDRFSAMRKLLPGASGGRAPAGGGGGPGTSGALALKDDMRAEFNRLAPLFGAFKLTPEQLRQFRTIEGSDTEPWDVLLSMLALDEHHALELLGQRTGLKYVAEPRLSESASRFYEIVPPEVARTHHCAGVESDGITMTVATAQPMQPSVINMLEDMLDGAITLVLSPRATVANLVNRGYEKRQDLVTEIIEEMPLDERAIASAGSTSASPTTSSSSHARRLSSAS
jgi:hypothetical protein